MPAPVAHLASLGARFLQSASLYSLLVGPFVAVPAALAGQTSGWREPLLLAAGASAGVLAIAVILAVPIGVILARLRADSR